MQASRDKDEAEDLRRRAAVTRFLDHLRESVSELELMSSLIQAGAVWYDLDARAYRRELTGRFVLEAWLPGADLAHAPKEIDEAVLASPAGPTRISSINELEQAGWQSDQGEVLLLPLVVSGVAERCLVVAGSVDEDVESTLMMVCRAAGAVLERLADRRGRDVRARLARAASAAGAFRDCLGGVMREYVAAVDAAAVRVVLLRPGQPLKVMYSTGAEGWATSPVPKVAPGAADKNPARIAMGFAWCDRAGVVELLAPPTRPFTRDRADAATAGLEVLGVWLAGVSVGETRVAVPAPAAPAPTFEDTMRDELARARRLSLTGGILVASVPGGKGPDPQVLSAVIHTIRAELRSLDLLGQLEGGDIAAVLVRTNPEGVARAADRVRQRLDALARTRRIPPVVLGHALYRAGQWGTPGDLIARGRKQAGLVFS